MNDQTPPTPPRLEDIQYWTGVIGEAQQMMLEAIAEAQGRPGALDAATLFGDPERIAAAQAEFWRDSVQLWQHFLDPAKGPASPVADKAARDKRFAAPQWADNPIFDLIRQSYLMLCGYLLRGIDAIEGLTPKQREQLRFATQAFADAMSPSNFALTNPLVLEKAIETKGRSLLKGLEHMLADLSKGQLTQTDPAAFTIGENIAATPGKVIKRTPLYELIHYAPTTETVNAIPVVIFPAWINRFYILDLNPEKSFVRWSLDQGLSVFVVSWKSADASMAGMTMDDYVLGGQLDAIDTVRDLLGVESVHAIGYCVAGTHLAALLAYLAAKGEAHKITSATFLAAQVDFTAAGDLNLFVSDTQLELIGQLAGEKGYLDGRYMAAAFNLLRGRDLIWSYVVNNYLLGQDYMPFDLLHWNGDTTNLPLRWHVSYLQDCYRDNKLVQPGGISIGGVPIDLRRVETPTYVQAGREDHIAPAESVWKATQHFAGPVRFVLAGSGHIAGVINPPQANKYQHWTNDSKTSTLSEFLAGATETKGSWWPDWAGWVRALSSGTVPAKRSRVPGKGTLKAIEDAPGRYVRTR